VTSSSVVVDGQTVAEIGHGLMVFLGLRIGDAAGDADYMAAKIPSLRIFGDAEGKMNLSVADVCGQILVVSQFTLYGNTRKGCRPSFVDAMPVSEARAMWAEVESRFQSCGVPCQFGVFQGDMKCVICNDGPVTLILDSADIRK
jgi:D-tyrosyl-tRNA(Tyr) deacylase